MTPAQSVARTPVWGFEDLVLVVGAILPSLLVGVLVVRAARAVAPGWFSSEGASTLIYQSVFYLVLLAVLYMVIVLRYNQPFLRALDWTLAFRGAWMCVVFSPVLALGLSALGVVMHTPVIANPIEELMRGGISRFAVMLLVAVLGPLWEELMFRGFLYPLLARSVGPWPGIFLSAAPFALIHGAQNQWAWQPLLIIGLAGVVFGIVRYKTGSTAAAALMHMGYNTTLLVGFLALKS